MEEEEIERTLQAKGLTAARVTPADLDAAIDDRVKPQFHRFPGTTVTVCCVRLRNGYTVVGHSACASEENYDQELGEKLALEHARNQLWPLLGFALREKLAATPALAIGEESA